MIMSHGAAQGRTGPYLQTVTYGKSESVCGAVFGLPNIDVAYYAKR